MAALLRGVDSAPVIAEKSNLAHEYARCIQAATVYDIASVSPVMSAPRLSVRLGQQAFLKREHLQPGFSFKCRGAHNKMGKLPQPVLDRGVVVASAGNHAQGVALAARQLGCKAHIVMPVTTPLIKVEAVQT